jgi:hypothetical protein
LCHCDKIPDINNLRKEGFIVSEVSVHHARRAWWSQAALISSQEAGEGMPV